MSSRNAPSHPAVRSPNRGFQLAGERDCKDGAMIERALVHNFQGGSLTIEFLSRWESRWVTERLHLWRFTCSREVVSEVTQLASEKKLRPRNPRESPSLRGVRSWRQWKNIFDPHRIHTKGETVRLEAERCHTKTLREVGTKKGEAKVPVLIQTTLEEVLPEARPMVV